MADHVLYILNHRQPSAEVSGPTGLNLFVCKQINLLIYTRQLSRRACSFALRHRLGFLPLPWGGGWGGRWSPRVPFAGPQQWGTLTGYRCLWAHQELGQEEGLGGKKMVLGIICWLCGIAARAALPQCHCIFCRVRYQSVWRVVFSARKQEKRTYFQLWLKCFLCLAPWAPCLNPSGWWRGCWHFLLQARYYISVCALECGWWKHYCCHKVWGSKGFKIFFKNLIS